MLVIERHLPGTYLDGAAMLGEAERPVIGMTLRYDRLDNFWFVLFHELGHVFRHLRRGMDFFDDDEATSSDEVEREADRFALMNLISDEEWGRCLSRFSATEELVRRDAERLGVHASILAGRIRRELSDYTVLGKCLGRTWFEDSSVRGRMILGRESYVPVLRWRQAEYQALHRLAPAVRKRVVPLITIPQIEYDFEHQRMKYTVQKFVEPFVRRYLQKWGFRPAWVALHETIALGRMDGGVHVFDHVFDGLRRSRTRALPAVRLSEDSATVAAAARAVSGGADGAGMILSMEDLASPSARDEVEALGDELGVRLDRFGRGD